jgi:hypothetical protein
MRQNQFYNNNNDQHLPILEKWHFTEPEIDEGEQLTGKINNSSRKRKELPIRIEWQVQLVGFGIRRAA